MASVNNRRIVATQKKKRIKIKMLSDKPEKEAPKEFLMVSFAYAVANRLLYNYRLLFSVIIMRELGRERKEGEDFHSSFGRYYDRQIHPDGSTES